MTPEVKYDNLFSMTAEYFQWLRSWGTHSKVHNNTAMLHHVTGHGCTTKIMLWT